MSRKPHVFTGSEPAGPVRNDAGPFPLASITAGSDAWHQLFGPNGLGGLPYMSEYAALTVSAIYACVSLIAGAIATLPLKIYARSPDGELDELPSDDLWWMLNEQMLPRWSAADGWEFMGQAKLVRGDGFGKILRDPNGKILGVEPLHYDRVTPIPVPDGRRLIYVIAADPTIPAPANREAQVLDQDDVLHFAGFGFNGVRGLSPLRHHLRLTGAVANAAQEYSARFFANGARPDYALLTEQNLAPAKVDEIRGMIEDRHKGPANAHRPMILTNGLKPESLALPADEMQLIATRKFQIEEICRVYGVPPFMVGHTENTAWVGTGIAAFGAVFVRYALRQHTNKIAGEINRKFFPRSSRKVVAFDTTDLEQADFKSLIEAFRAALGRAGEMPILTTEEIRGLLKLPRKPKFGSLERNPGNASPSAPAEPAQP